MTEASFVADDSASKLSITCKDNDTGVVVDLSGSTVRLRWKNAVGMVITKNMTVTSPKSGIAEYQFAEGDLTAGMMDFEVEIEDSTGNIMKSLDLLHEWVRRKVG